MYRLATLNLAVVQQSEEYVLPYAPRSWPGVMVSGVLFDGVTEPGEVRQQPGLPHVDRVAC